MEYTRKVQAPPGAAEGAAPARELAFGNVELIGAPAGQDTNASEMVVARGCVRPGAARAAGAASAEGRGLR